MSTRCFLLINSTLDLELKPICLPFNSSGASLSESFYGLTRFNLKSNGFKRKDFLLSLLVLVFLPYAFRKLKQKMTKLNEKLQDEMSIDDKYKVLGLYSYRTIKSTYEFVQIIKYVLYLSGRSQTHSIPFMITGLGLRHAAPETSSFSLSDIFKGDMKISTVLSSLALRALEFGGFFLQFLQWYQDSSASSKIQDQLPTPEPPKLDKNANKYSNICPLCLQTFVIPTAVSVSGYVYCYKCITNHLKKHQYCPVSNYPCTMDDLARVYDS